MAGVSGVRLAQTDTQVTALTVRSTLLRVRITYKIEAITGATIVLATTLPIATIAITTIKMVATTAIVSQK
jgi:hypothetical protein